jgi:hypothetical protein
LAAKLRATTIALLKLNSATPSAPPSNAPMMAAARPVHFSTTFQLSPQK